MSIPSRSSTDWKTDLTVSFVPTVILECDSFHHNVTRHALEFKGVDDQFGRYDRMIHTVECILAAVRCAVNESPTAARSYVHPVHGGR
jgi:hypothetical protein